MISELLVGRPLKYSVTAIMNQEIGQMVYDLLSPGGQHLAVNQDSIQITENKKLCKVYGWADAKENYENVAVLYSHLTLLEEGTIKVSKRSPSLHLMCLTLVRVAEQSGGGP